MTGWSGVVCGLCVVGHVRGGRGFWVVRGGGIRVVGCDSHSVVTFGCGWSGGGGVGGVGRVGGGGFGASMARNDPSLLFGHIRDRECDLPKVRTGGGTGSYKALVGIALAVPPTSLSVRRSLYYDKIVLVTTKCSTRELNVVDTKLLSAPVSNRIEA
ncbi:hypothetical protein Tco_0855439 [Tanacetum coccineum]